MMMSLAKIGPLTALIGCLALGGCACLKDIEPFSGNGFVAPHVAHPRVAAHRPRIAPQPVSMTEPETALSNCTKSLYLETGKSPDELKALENKCRAVIVNQ